MSPEKIVQKIDRDGPSRAENGNHPLNKIRRTLRGLFPLILAVGISKTAIADETQDPIVDENDSPLGSFIEAVDAPPENPLRNHEDFMALFPGLRIHPKDFIISIAPDATDPRKNVITVQLNRFFLRGKIHSVEPGKLKITTLSEGDDKVALREALSKLAKAFRATYRTFTEENAEGNKVPDNFKALKDLLAQPEYSDVYGLRVIEEPQNPSTVGEPFRHKIRVPFEVDGSPGEISLREPNNRAIQGNNSIEARDNAYADVMRLLPAAVEETRKAAAAHADYLLAADHPEKLLPVTPSEQYAYFLNSLEQKPNGTITFELFDPVTKYSSPKPCKVTLSTKGLLTIDSPIRRGLTFQLSFTATPYGKKTEQEFRGIRLLRTDQPPAPGVKGHPEVSQNPGHPWIDQITDRGGRVVARDIVLSEQFLHGVTRKILQQNALVLDGLGQDKIPPDFSGQYEFSNNFNNIARITPEDMRLRTGGERMWIQKIEQ